MNDYYWLNEDSRKFLSKEYLSEGETPESRIRYIAESAENILKIKGFADKFESYMKKGWYSLSSPIWANFGNKRGYPISCNGSYIDDTMDSILEKVNEVGVMTKNGAGTSAYFGALRPRGSKISVGGTSPGPVHFMELFDVTCNIVSQSNIRRGSFAAYLPVEHPDILEFLKIRDTGHKIQSMSFGVTISDEWMGKMLDGDKEKRDIWANIIRKRFESGYPYIFFSDNVNQNAPQVYKDKGIKIYASNLCSEILLSSSPEESFVCNLSSMNLLHYEEWKTTDAVEVLLFFLDAVMTEYIEKTDGVKGMTAAHTFAKRQRAIGLGVLGWHSYLQSRMIAFESIQAKMKNIEIHKFIHSRCEAATKSLAGLYGEPEMLKGYGRRNTTTMALAPTTSSSFILGQVSPSIEPLHNNYLIKDLAKGKFTYKNPYLIKLLEAKGKNNDKVWESILIQGGSVQHLDFLSNDEKDIFKTFAEISQKEIVIQASARQKYIDQTQSLNLMIPANARPKDVSDLLIEGWRLGIKTFYYQRSSNPSQDLARKIFECASCAA